MPYSLRYFGVYLLSSAHCPNICPAASMDITGCASPRLVSYNSGPNSVKSSSGLSTSTRKKPPRLPRRSPASLTLPDSIIFCICGPSHSLRMVLASGKTMFSLTSKVRWNSIFDPSFLPLQLKRVIPFYYDHDATSRSPARTSENSILRTKFVNKGKKKRKGREGERYSGPVIVRSPSGLALGGGNYGGGNYRWASLYRPTLARGRLLNVTKS